MISDFELVAGITRRDPEAFRELMERHASGVVNLAWRFLGTVADSEDVAQEVFFRLYQNPPHLDSNAKLTPWLYRVTVNLCLDFLRKRPSRSQIVSLEAGLSEESEEGLPLSEKLPGSPLATPREQVARAELAAHTRRAIASLPASLRVPLVLSTFEELSHQEIAQILKVSPKAVERRISRARSLLKARLKPYL